MRDDTDLTLLRHLQNRPDASLEALARLAGVPAQLAARRMARLRQDGILKGRHARIDWRAMGYEVEVSLRFTLDKSDPRAFDAFLAAARTVPQVTEIQTFLGRVDVRLCIVARDLAHYHEIYRHRIVTLPHVAEIEALMHVASIKSESRVPL